jgi:hypothetical protein
MASGEEPADAAGLDYGGPTEADGKGCAEAKLQPDDGGERCTEQGEPDFYEGSCSGICFHDSNLVHHRRRVLIERFH